MLQASYSPKVNVDRSKGSLVTRSSHSDALLMSAGDKSSAQAAAAIGHCIMLRQQSAARKLLQVYFAQ